MACDQATAGCIRQAFAGSDGLRDWLAPGEKFGATLPAK